MIRFKVVAMTIRYNKAVRVSVYAEGRYKQEYPKGVIVEPGHLGVMVFDTRKNARNFIRNNLYYKIIKVKVFGKARKPKWISSKVNWESIKWFYDMHVWLKKYNFSAKMKPPKGTLCYKSVMAIE